MKPEALPSPSDPSQMSPRESSSNSPKPRPILPAMPPQAFPMLVADPSMFFGGGSGPMMPNGSFPMLVPPVPTATTSETTSSTGTQTASNGTQTENDDSPPQPPAMMLTPPTNGTAPIRGGFFPFPGMGIPPAFGGILPMMGGAPPFLNGASVGGNGAPPVMGGMFPVMNGAPPMMIIPPPVTTPPASSNGVSPDPPPPQCPAVIGGMLPMMNGAPPMMALVPPAANGVSQNASLPQGLIGPHQLMSGMLPIMGGTPPVVAVAPPVQNSQTSLSNDHSVTSERSSSNSLVSGTSNTNGNSSPSPDTPPVMRFFPMIPIVPMPNIQAPQMFFNPMQIPVPSDPKPEITQTSSTPPTPPKVQSPTDCLDLSIHESKETLSFSEDSASNPFESKKSTEVATDICQKPPEVKVKTEFNIQNMEQVMGPELIKEEKPEALEIKQEEAWYESEKTLRWIDCKVALYNPQQKVFKCINCETTAYLTKIAEHWLATHANMRVFQCPQCPYSSAWARCVRMHLARQHNEHNVDTISGAFSPLLEEVITYLQQLKNKVDNQVEATGIQCSDKKYCCPICAYATDRKDLYSRHENIHRDVKPFHCYVCEKQFNRADHVKKHFVRIHSEVHYDVNKIRRDPSVINGSPLDAYYGSNQQASPKTVANRTNGDASPPLTPVEKYTLPYRATLFPIDPVETKPIKKEVITEPEDPNIYAGISISNNEEKLKWEIEELKKSLKKENTIITPVKVTKPVKIETPVKRKRKPKDAAPKTPKKLDKTYPCPFCPWVGADTWVHKRHLNTHIKPYTCPDCGYKCARGERLATHVMRQHGKFTCKKCNYVTVDPDDLQEHGNQEQ